MHIGVMLLFVLFAQLHNYTYPIIAYYSLINTGDLMTRHRTVSEVAVIGPELLIVYGCSIYFQLVQFITIIVGRRSLCIIYCQSI